MQFKEPRLERCIPCDTPFVQLTIEEFVAFLYVEKSQFVCYNFTCLLLCKRRCKEVGDRTKHTEIVRQLLLFKLITSITFR